MAVRHLLGDSSWMDEVMQEGKWPPLPRQDRITA